MQTPRYWRKLQRHPLSADYPDITGPAREKAVANLKTHGILGKRTITLFEGKILDGWQLHTWCIEAGVKPTYQNLPKGITPEAFVETMNDHRRHETQELQEGRAARRRDRVAEARTAGFSERQIAKQEGVSQKTIHEDLKRSTDTGVSVEPPDGKITGIDGRTRTAKPAREPGDDTDTIADDSKGPKPGQVIYDPKPYRNHLGGLVREIDVVRRAYRAQESPKAEGLRRMLAEFKASFEGYVSELKKANK